MKIIFLTFEEIITLHDALIKRFGGLSGLRDKGLLESAIYQPEITLGGKFAYQSLFAMSAAYAFGIIKNHAFFDGNKRTGMVAALLFLKRNNIEITLTND
jgi:death-on-curing protein